MSTFLFSPLRVVGGTAVGVGVGAAVADAISPVVRELANEAWSRYLSMPIDAVAAAALVASGERDVGWGIAEASNTGIGEDRFRALVDMIDEAPDLATLYDLLHRRLISVADFREGARKGNIEDKWVDALVDLSERILSPAEAAQARQRGYMTEAEQIAEASLSGVSPERAQIQFESAGLPPPPETAMQMLRRGIIGPADFEQMIREGNTKTKYTDEYLELRNRVLSGPEWASLRLRGWVTEAEAIAGGAAEGWTPEQMELLYLNRGRPATSRQIHIGYARGGRVPDRANEEAAFRAAVAQSNVRTEYADVLWAQRHTYPSAFVIRALAQEGTFDRATTERILVESGWVPEYARLAAESWTGAGDEAEGGPWTKSARRHVFNRVHTEFVARQITPGEASAALASAAIPGDEVSRVVALWTIERDTVRTELTQAQIVKAWKKGLYDEAEALAELQERGLSPRDAGIRLQSG